MDGMTPDPGRKASDSGLSGLGLIMQLVGGVMTAVVASYGMIMLIALLQAGGRGAPGSIILFLLAVLATSIARSVMHAAAGRRLCYEGPGTPLSALKRYVTMSFVQTGVVCVGLMVNDAPGGIMMALALILAAWPIVLLIVAKPKIEEFGDAVPMADDKGFEGASILLLVFGSIGVGIGAIMLMGWLDWPGEMKGSLLGMGMLVAFVMLLIRSILHLRAGARGVKATLLAETAEAAGKYASFGVVAAMVAGGVFLIGMISQMGEARGAGGVMMLMLFMVVMITWVLLVWPLAVKRFFGDRQFATMVEERGPSAQLSADRGLCTLGWLLLAFGTYALASGFGSLLMGDMGDDGGFRRGRGDNPFEQMMGLMGNVGGKSPWFGIATAALQMWAGIELIRLTPRYKIAGMVFGGVAAAIALYIYLPMIGDMAQGGLAMISNPLAGMSFASIAMALVVPIMTFIFVQRKVRDSAQLAKTFE